MVDSSQSYVSAGGAIADALVDHSFSIRRSLIHCPVESRLMISCLRALSLFDQSADFTDWATKMRAVAIIVAVAARAVGCTEASGAVTAAAMIKAGMRNTKVQ
jgi:hypothetical protein